MNRPLGVGFVGAGLVTQAVHLPTLAVLRDRLRTVAVADIDEAAATAVAARCPGARTCTVDELLQDPTVDVVVVSSPDHLHASQVIAAIEAGKRGVLCEKPFATTANEARSIVDATAVHGVPIVVGAMHVYDPAWVAASTEWEQLTHEATLVRSTIYLPPNEEFTALATEQPPAVEARSGQPVAVAPPPTPARMIRMGVLGLATHTVPHLRRFFHRPPRVASARYVAPWGYHLVIEEDGKIGELLALVPGEWAPAWRFEAYAPSAMLEISYPPSFVLAGSATATVSITGGESRSWRSTVNGYQREWQHLADVIEGKVPLAHPVQEVADDLTFALGLADGADQLLESHL